MLLNRRYIPPPKSDAACQLCQDLRIRPVDGVKYGSLGIRLQDLPEAAKAGCFICGVLFESVTDLFAPLKGFAPLPTEEVFGITISSEARPESNGQGCPLAPLTIAVQTEHAYVGEMELYTPVGEHCRFSYLKYFVGFITPLREYFLTKKGRN
jgi:hypothetical protein